MPPAALSAKKLMTSHFGNPLSEQRKLLEGKAFINRDDQSVLEIKGVDSKSWLHSLTSQNILNLDPFSSTESLLLDPQGHVEQQLKVIFDGESVYLIVKTDHLETLIAWLKKMVFRKKVELLERPDLLVVGSFVDLEIGELNWIDSWSTGFLGGFRYAKEVADFPYREALVQELPSGFEQAGMLAFDALRVSAGRPAIEDTDERSLPHEFDWMATAVHLSKGCYRGQESVAKIHNLGHPPRRLVILELEQGDVLAQKNDLVFYGEKQVGAVVAGALHFEQGSIALALLNRNTPYLDLLVQVAGQMVAATQQVLVPFDAGKAANLPRPSAFKLSGKK